MVLPNVNYPHEVPPVIPPSEQSKVRTGTLTVSSLLGLTTAILAVIGLAGAAPVAILSICVMTLGLLLVLRSGGMTMKLRELAETSGDSVAAGVSVQSFAGAGSFGLGLLALIGVAPLVLCSVAIVGLGAGLALETGVLYKIAPSKDSHRSMMTGLGFEVFAGLGAAILGLLALLGFDPLEFNLASALVLGCAMAFVGLVASGKSYGLSRFAQR